MTTLQFELQVHVTDHCVPNYSYHYVKKGEILDLDSFRNRRSIRYGKY